MSAGGDWRARRAEAFDEEADVIDRALEQLAEVHGIFEASDDEAGAHEVRSIAATLRSKVSERRSEARSLRATPVDNGRQLPAALTTRHVRGARP